EIAFPFLVWFKQTKFWIFLGGVFLHIGIWIFMRIDNFSWVMLSTYFVFITNEEFRSFQSKKIRVFIDGWCPICRKFGDKIKKVDLFNLIIIEDIRSSKVPNIEFRNKGLLSMASIDDKGKSSFGFDSIFKIAVRIPILWLTIPILLIFKLTKIGNYVYNELAIKRAIIPIHCDDNCEIKSS
ncbi:MAG: DCC1-like thiol-disulfide oxidoreductase family protein, partial [Capnocytophaga sp.]|nr:DCC1-like thiol-disulfide oxidoreductase family protein [Capnocytophaga sp.]